MTMAKSSAVHTPRNVDLPPHVIRPKKSSKKSENRRKRCLCLSCWLLGLVLLCAGVVVIAHFLLPTVGQTNDSNILGDESQSVELISDNACIDRTKEIYSLEQKLQMSDTIVVGIIDKDSIHVTKVLKEGSDKKIDKNVRLDSSHEMCHLETRSRQIFFLSSPILSNKNSSTEFEKTRSTTEVFRPRFRSMLTTPKLVQVIVRILSNEGSNSGENDRQEQRVEYSQLSQNQKGSGEDFEMCLTFGLECKYGSKCVQVKTSPTRSHHVDDKVKCSCHDICDEDLDIGGPVCGSDHVTYKNSCSLKEAACGKQENITILAESPCREANLCGACLPYQSCQRDPLIGQYRCMCQECEEQLSKDLVCGDDGVEYSNVCELNLASCNLRKPISVRNKGECDLCKDVKCPVGLTCESGQCICPQVCPDQYQPVCGSDGRTHFNECWLSCFPNPFEAVPNPLKVIHRGQCDLSKPDCSLKGRLKGEFCECPLGHSGPKCDKCMPNYWAYTSFGCRECKCSEIGSQKSDCDPESGKCNCKIGFSGEKCQICPDGTMSNVTGCASVSTRYKTPVACGDMWCDFGATCSSQGLQPHCVCEIDCRDPKYLPTPVCGSDGNTYRSECQLRQYSCRIQREVAVMGFGPCKDAPSSIYGPEKTTRQADILSDGTASTSVFGLLGDVCLDNRDCFIDFSSCSENICACLPGYNPTAGNISCEVEFQSLCHPNPCHGGGTCEEHDGVFTCYCPEGFTGSQCQHDVTKTNISVASFVGDSLVGVITPEESVSRVEIDLVFRTFSDEGILVYADGGRQPASSGSNPPNTASENDFLSLAIIQGFVEFRYDLGSGVPLVLRSADPVKLGHWHHVVAKRYHQDGLLTLDGGERVTGQSRGSLKTLNIGQLSWIGGVDTDTKETALKRVGTSSGFNGCVKDFRFGRNVVSVQSELEPLIMRRKHVVECSEHPCATLPCDNQGSCSADDQGFVCTCKNNFAGRRCQRERNQCHPNPCKNHGRCQIEGDHGFTCQCKTGFLGRLCEQNMNEQKDSNARRYRKSIDHDGHQKITFSLTTNITDQCLMAIKVNYWGESVKRKLILSTDVDGKLELAMEVKESPDQPVLVGFSDFSISDNKWHRINLSHQHGHFKLTVDQELTSDVKPILKSLSFLTFLNEPLEFCEASVGRRLCLQSFHITWWKNGRKRKTKSHDICR